MKDIFSLSRWWLLVRKTWYENKKKYILFSITIAALMLALYTVYMLLLSREMFYTYTQAIFYFTGLFMGGSLFASVLFSDLASKAKGISFLTIPASHLEKLLCGMFYLLLVFTITYTAVFYIIDIPAVKINNANRYHQWQIDREIAIAQKKAYTAFEPTLVTNVLKYPNEDQFSYTRRNHPKQEEPNYYYFVWLLYLAVSAFYSLGSVYYGRFSFVKTTVTALGLAIFFFLFFQLLNIFFPSDSAEKSYSLFSLLVSNENYSTVYSNPAWFGAVDVILLQYLFQPLFWIVAYIRLKEKQI